MKKKFTLEIKSPCTENFDAMIPNSQGSFCASCAKNVIDLSHKTNTEVAQFISKNKGKNICAKLRTTQLQQEFEMTETAKSTNFKYAVAVAASVLLSSNVVGQENKTPKVETCEVKPYREIMGKIAYVQPKKEMISFTFKGKLLDKNTKKPLTEKEYPNYIVYITGATEQVKIDKKTGEFSAKIAIDSKVNQLNISVQSNDMHWNKNIEIDPKLIKNGSLNKNISIPTKEFQNDKIYGGLGVNYIDKKSNPLS